MKIRFILVVACLMVTGTAHAASLNVSCTDSPKSLNISATPALTVKCPANCTSGSVWGTDTYTTDSALCVAAVHAGAIGLGGGEVAIQMAPGLPSYSGTVRNGVTTGAWGAYEQSFKVSALSSSTISCTDSVKSLNKSAESAFKVECPANCTSGSVWGTDIYTTDSSICRSAIQAGVITLTGGPVKVQLSPGQPSYVGTAKNGVTSSAWGAYEKSFKVMK